ncbi:uncharacterized protein METZ01_LOCUS438364, partial [marine metagenome]
MTGGTEVLPSVGVIVPNHDRIDQLVEAVESVQDQTYTGRVQTYVVYRPRPEFDQVLRRWGDS